MKIRQNKNYIIFYISRKKNPLGQNKWQKDNLIWVLT